MQHRCRAVLHLLYALLLLTATTGSAELLPQHLAVLVNRSELESVQLGHYYAKQRGIPETHVIPLDLGPLQDHISRKAYNDDIVQPLRTALEKRRLTGQIRALVTVYGMPLSVQAPQPTPQELAWAADAETRYQRALQALETLAQPLSSAEVMAQLPREEAERAAALLDHIQRAVQERSRRVQTESDRQAATAATRELVQLVTRVGGRAALMQSIRHAPQAQAQQQQAEMARLQQYVAQGQAALEALLETPSEANRQRAYRITEGLLGLNGVLRLAKTEVEAFRYLESDASVDSELSLLWLDPTLYRLAGRRANPLHYSLQPTSGSAPSGLPILMVSRLDAPTPALVRQLVDQTMATEQRGLQGTVYIDSRGIKTPGPPWSTSAYDKSLQDLAELFRRVTTHPVVLEETERTFSQPGEAPNVAVYVGWYRYRSYEDAFTFVPGALGYHIASGEAVSVHDPHEPGWCKNALERGIAATLGPTGEPYLDAFPAPAELFGFLLTGQYTLAEAYYLSSRYISWRMVLFGDPLYNPWRGKALASAEHVLLQAKNGAPAEALPRPPSALPFPDPLQTMQQLQQRRQTLVQEVEALERELERREREESGKPPALPAAQPPAGAR